MALSLPAVWQIEFDALVKQAYQKGTLLRPYCRVNANTVGKTHEFRRLGRGVARPHIAFTDRTPMGVQFAKAIATLTDWDATEFSDRLDASKVNFAEQPLLAESVGMAIGRRMDQILIDALAANFGAATILDGGTGLTDAKLRQVKRIFDNRAVPMNERFLVTSPKGVDDIMSEARFASRDFGETNAVRSGVVPPIYGMTVLMVEPRDEGGLPIGGGVRQSFAYDKQSLGLAIGMETAVAVDYLPAKTCWQINEQLAAGAVVVDPEGAIRIDITET